MMPLQDLVCLPKTIAVMIGFCALSLTAMTGCAKKSAMPAAPPPVDSIVGSENDHLQESLFKGDQAVLSNQDIDRILNARISLADRRRMAVLRLNARYIWFQDTRSG